MYCRCVLALFLLVGCSREKTKDAEKASFNDKEGVETSSTPVKIPVLPNHHLDDATARYIKYWSHFWDLREMMDISPALRDYLFSDTDKSELIALDNTYQRLSYKVKSIEEKLYKIVKSRRFSDAPKPIKSRMALLYTYVLKLRSLLMSDPYLTDAYILSCVDDIYSTYDNLVKEIIRENIKKQTKYDIDIMTMPRW